MKKDTLTYLHQGVTSERAKKIISNVYAYVMASGVNLEFSTMLKNLGRDYQSAGLDLKLSTGNVRDLDNLTLIEQVTGTSYIIQKLTLLSHLSANLCSVKEYNNSLKELNSRFSDLIWKDLQR